MKFHIVYLDSDSIPEYANLGRPNFQHSWQSYPFTKPEEIVQRSQSADILVLNKVSITEAVICHLPRLKMIAVPATGLDNIDGKACQKQGIVVKNVLNYASQTVAEHTLMLMLSLLRQLNQYRHQVLSGGWHKSSNFCLHQFPVRDLADQQVALVGQGAIGAKVARLCQAFGAETYFLDAQAFLTNQAHRSDYVDFMTGIKQADILSLHCPVTAQNRHFIDARIFAAMKPSALVINTARGGLINQQHALQALKQGRIAGLGLDGVDPEPIDNSNPFNQILDWPQLLITPHCGWLGRYALQQLCEQTISNIEQFYQQYCAKSSR